MEKLYELHRDGRFDLVVVDTPPTRHALDFLDAPGRLTRFLDNRIFRLLMMPTRAGLRAIGVATQMFLRTVSKVVGGAMVADAVAFFAAFEGMEQGFRDRAAKVEQLLVDGTTAFVVVASPRRDAVEEALYFADRLRESSGRVEALVVNRMFPRFGPVPVDARPPPRLDASRSAALAANLADLDRVASREEQHVAVLAERLPGAPVVRVPFLADDVHDVDGLTRWGVVVRLSRVISPSWRPATTARNRTLHRLEVQGGPTPRPGRSFPGRRCLLDGLDHGHDAVEAGRAQQPDQGRAVAGHRHVAAELAGAADAADRGRRDRPSRRTGSPTCRSAAACWTPSRPAPGGTG